MVGHPTDCSVFASVHVQSLCGCIQNVISNRTLTLKVQYVCVLQLQFLCVLNELFEQNRGGDNSLIIPQVHMYLFANVRCVLILT